MMESVVSPPPFLSGSLSLSLSMPMPILPRKRSSTLVRSSLPVTQPDPWSPHQHPSRPKPRSKNPKNPLSDDSARRIIHSKALYLSSLRKHKGPLVHTPRWIKRTPLQTSLKLPPFARSCTHSPPSKYSVSQRRRGDYNIRKVMSGFVCKLTSREMCVVLKEQKDWRQVRDFFSWMKLQILPSLLTSLFLLSVRCSWHCKLLRLSYRPSVIAYTIVLRIYGQVGKINMAEEIFLKMLEAGCEPDEVACRTMLCTYARWGRHQAMLSFLSAIEERRRT